MCSTFLCVAHFYSKPVGCEGAVSQGDVSSSDEDFNSKVDLKVKFCK